ncbi:MAG: UDP-N-acetylmuramoyl-L-alanyl-D-glutamate--2,6-diaminopimelate ligase [Candidatus Levybacteria bacterium]|nr:UDP-N-acetylmuramoyl-L-alanyl-D-glutamate--2,6-diaminopimelate ligase [Candidatus Levybacteria bacterium]
MWQKIKNIYHLLNAFLANLWYGFPSKKLTVIGVTGTDGKTTTVNLIYHILRESGCNISMISSVGAIINGKNYEVGFHVTTPSSWMIQRFLKIASVAKGSYVVVEVTSHALDQNRVWGIDFRVGVLTNVTKEHLDYHKTYENYVNTKAKLLKSAKTSIINKDDGSYSLISTKKNKKSKFMTYGLKQDAEINPRLFPFKTRLIGEFNKYNVLAAVGACKALGLKDDQIRRGVESFEAPIGREEIVYKNLFTVMVDFAHTPNALEQILSSIRPSVRNKLIHVFGSAGQRDFQKRPQMGGISSKYADVIILTAEDSRTEPLHKINNEIISGIEDKIWKIEGKRLLVRDDRQEAINEAIGMAKKGDFVLLTGKAHEKSMNLGHGEEPWDEYEAVKKALEKRRI